MRQARRIVAYCLALLLSPMAFAVATIGELAPPLQGTLFDGRLLDLAQYRGKVVLVNFYSSYCKFCALEIGNIEEHYEKLKPRGLEVIMLSIERGEDRERARRFVDNYSLPGSMVIDLQRSGFGARHPTPTCYVIDRNGVVRDKITGAKTPSFYQRVVVPLLNE